MSRHVPSYLRTHRKRSGLTQRELALLLGCQSEAKVSRYERLIRKPCLETAFACQVVFGATPHQLFPGMYASVEQIVTTRARLLAQTLSGHELTPLIDHKICVLRAIINRTPSAY